MTPPINSVSDERIAEHLSVGDSFHAVKSLTAAEVSAALRELLSRRAANSAGGVEVADKSYRSPREDAAYFGSVWSLSTNQMAELEKTFEYHRDHHPSFGTDYPGGSATPSSIGQSGTLHPLADREKSASLSALVSPPVEEPVAHPLDDIAGPAARRLFQYTRTFNAIAAATTQNAVGIGISVRAFIKAFGPIDLDILPHPSSPVSAEVTEAMVERMAVQFQNIMAVTLSVDDGDIMGTGKASYQMARAALLAALNGGRENG